MDAVIERTESINSVASDIARGGLETYADIWPPKIDEVPEVRSPPAPTGRPQKFGGRPGRARRKAVDKEAKPEAKPPEKWQEILGLVEPPPPPEVCGGVRVKAIRARDGSDGAMPHSEETAHVAEWTIQHLETNVKLLKVMYKNLFVPPGQHITSHHFRIAGADAYLRFWPNGFWGVTTKKERLRMDLGGLRANSWCAIALSMPIDTRLTLRFRIGEHRSEIRECQWEATGFVIQQVWMPPEPEPPEDLKDLVVGVEIFRSFQRKPLPEPVSGARGLPSPRQYQLPAVDEDPMHGLISAKHKMKEHLKDGVQALQHMRLGKNLALPSPRYGNSAEELWRRAPRCQMRSA